MKALLVGGTGPTGPCIVHGLLLRNYSVSILHTGSHEIDLPHEVEHIHVDPHFEETLESGLRGRSFDLCIATYGRLRFVAKVMRNKTPRFISVGGGGYYRALNARDPAVRVPLPIPEDAPLQDDPILDKFTYRGVEAERAVMQAHAEGCYNATHLRYPLLYGPRQNPPREWSIIRRILDHRKRLMLADGGLAVNSRGYTQNMAQAVMLAVDNPALSAGQIYNVRDQTLLSGRDWINAICLVMDYTFEFVNIPYSIARPSHIYCGLSRHHVLDISKIQRELGYRDLVPFEKGLALTVEWYLSNLNLQNTLFSGFDPFDYAVEDRIMDAFADSSKRLKAV